MKETSWIETDEILMFNTGFNACRLAYELYPEEDIYMIGFDIFGKEIICMMELMDIMIPNKEHFEEKGWGNYF